VQQETNATHWQKSKVHVEKPTRTSDDSSQEQTNDYSKSMKIKPERCVDVPKHLLENGFPHSCRLYTQQSRAVDNLLQKLEDHIANELTR
jgi:hypothetical protein